MTLGHPSQARFTRGGSSGVTVTPVSVISLGTFLLFSIPRCLSSESLVLLEDSIAHSSLALKTGLVN